MTTFENTIRPLKRGKFGYSGGHNVPLQVFPVFEPENDSDILVGDLSHRISREFKGRFDTSDKNFQFFAFGEFNFEGDASFEVNELTVEALEILNEMLKELIEKYDIGVILNLDELDDSPSHQTHCCEIHGCKYGYNETCPVYRKVVIQAYLCQDCTDPDEMLSYIKNLETEIAELRVEQAQIVALDKKVGNEQMRLREESNKA